MLLEAEEIKSPQYHAMEENGIFLVQIQKFPAQVCFALPLVGLVFCQDGVHCVVLNKLQKSNLCVPVSRSPLNSNK